MTRDHRVAMVTMSVETEVERVARVAVVARIVARHGCVAMVTEPVPKRVAMETRIGARGGHVTRVAVLTMVRFVMETCSRAVAMETSAVAMETRAMGRAWFVVSFHCTSPRGGRRLVRQGPRKILKDLGTCIFGAHV